MDIVFLQNSITQPRCHKRFRTFRKIGVNGIVYSFNRNLYNVNIPSDIPINILGEIASTASFKRLFFYIRKLRQILKKHKDSVFYCYGQDLAFVAALFNVKYIYEESDLVYLSFTNSVKRKLMKWMDLWLQKKSLATILTSQGFVEHLYKEKPKNVFVIPNKLDSYFLTTYRPATKTYNSEYLKFAFIGLLRYQRTISSFINSMVNHSSKYEFHIWGDGAESSKTFVKKLCLKFPKQVFYHGPFRNPLDLNQIYNQVDVNFVCYDTSGVNERIAEPNKLYESTFFNTPMLVSPNTYLSSVVNKWKIGFVVDCMNGKSIDSFFENLSINELCKKAYTCSQIDKSILIDSENQAREVLDFVDLSTK